MAGGDIPFMSRRQSRIKISAAFSYPAEFQRRSARSPSRAREVSEKMFRLRLKMRAADRNNHVLFRCLPCANLGPALTCAGVAAHRKLKPFCTMADDPSPHQSVHWCCNAAHGGTASTNDRNVHRELISTSEVFAGPIERIHQDESGTAIDLLSGSTRLLGNDWNSRKQAWQSLQDYGLCDIISCRNWRKIGFDSLRQGGAIKCQDGCGSL